MAMLSVVRTRPCLPSLAPLAARFALGFMALATLAALVIPSSPKGYTLASAVLVGRFHR